MHLRWVTLGGVKIRGTLRRINANGTADILQAMEDAFAEDQHVLLLFDGGLEDLHDRLLEEFIGARDPQDLIIDIHGGK